MDCALCGKAFGMCGCADTEITQDIGVPFNKFRLRSFGSKPFETTGQSHLPYFIYV